MSENGDARKPVYCIPYIDYIGLRVSSASYTTQYILENERKDKMM